MEEYYNGYEVRGCTEKELKYIVQSIQHERFIHLIVTMITGILWGVLGYMMFNMKFIVTDLLFLTVTILLMFYVRYYCWIENETQMFEKRLIEGKFNN